MILDYDFNIFNSFLYACDVSFKMGLEICINMVMFINMLILEY